MPVDAPERPKHGATSCAIAFGSDPSRRLPSTARCVSASWGAHPGSLGMRASSAAALGRKSWAQIHLFQVHVALAPQASSWAWSLVKACTAWAAEKLNTKFGLQVRVLIWTRRLWRSFSSLAARPQAGHSRCRAASLAAHYFGSCLSASAQHAARARALGCSSSACPFGPSLSSIVYSLESPFAGVSSRRHFEVRAHIDCVALRSGESYVLFALCLAGYPTEVSAHIVGVYPFGFACNAIAIVPFFFLLCSRPLERKYRLRLHTTGAQWKTSDGLSSGLFGFG